MKRPTLFLLSLALLLSVGCAMREAAVTRSMTVPADTAASSEPPAESTSAPAEPAPASLPEGAVIVYSSPEENDFAFVLPEGWAYDLFEGEAELTRTDGDDLVPATISLSAMPLASEDYLGMTPMLLQYTDLLLEEGMTFSPLTDITVGGQYAGKQTESSFAIPELETDFSVRLVAWETDTHFYAAYLAAPADEAEDDFATLSALLNGFTTARNYLAAGHTAPEPTPIPEISVPNDDPAALTTSAPKEVMTFALENAVLMDEDGLKVTALGFAEGWFGPALSLELANTSAREVTFTMDRPAVNGYMMDTMSLYATVPAGQTVVQEVSVYDSELARCGIDEIAVVEFELRVTADLWETVYTSPRLRLETDAIQTYTQVYADAGTPLYDTDELRILCPGLETDGWFGQTAVFTFVNASDRALAVSFRSAAINGIEADTFFSVTLLPGTRAVRVCYFSPAAGETFGDAYRTGTFAFHIYDAETYDTVADTEPVEITFE